MTRRQHVIACAGGLVALPSFQAQAANVAQGDFDFQNPFDPRVAGGTRGLIKQTDIVVPKNPDKPNTGIVMLRELFDGEMPSQGMVPWLEAKLAPDFQASFAGGKVIQNKEEYIKGSSELLKSFPDLAFTRKGSFKYADAPFLVEWTAVVKGTHSGAPYAPLPGLKPVSAQSPPVACQNDEEKVRVEFVTGKDVPKLSIIKKITVEALPGGKGFSGPLGFYVQAGGSPP